MKKQSFCTSHFRTKCASNLYLKQI